jgi:hypothetical protein
MQIGQGRRAERLARNQSLFRSINERIVVLRSSTDQPRSHFLCECASAGCVEHITITRAQYQHVRSNPVTFAVFPNPAHVFVDVERIVDRHPGHWVVQKFAAQTEFAHEWNPSGPPTSAAASAAALL